MNETVLIAIVIVSSITVWGVLQKIILKWVDRTNTSYMTEEQFKEKCNNCGTKTSIITLEDSTKESIKSVNEMVKNMLGGLNESLKTTNDTVKVIIDRQVVLRQTLPVEYTRSDIHRKDMDKISESLDKIYDKIDSLRERRREHRNEDK
jgi:hypothetical protein